MLPGMHARAQDVWQVDYVIVDSGSGATDNNGGRDYGLPLAGAPSETEVLAARAAAWEASERERLQARAFSWSLAGAHSCMQSPACWLPHSSLCKHRRDHAASENSWQGACDQTRCLRKMCVTGSGGGRGPAVGGGHGGGQGARGRGARALPAAA